ncbi:uncharacterized protein NECHADRAFT_76034 [Fusarium vanettenii 77-13-4]|uniref:F-box domain-containing protein n=1 Tax=Fusarium vanettenii (strain ATCC MYA-4622 / CBS 123669 / FGSC 9596 / NRRL 45880 / 77-13-4) TaxID=660122 RepID=C7Z6A5_FUSV7|nr:uncharacterized protein NECHADRAFT_76034 [Fusarium vanettenii 77-13-4]EEU40663.1 hypothetical protein NECHADRAFT_76034 [Fusarium vanettenii 77-13-4]
MSQSTARASPKRPPQHKHPQGHHNDSSIALSEQYHEQGCRSRDSECIISASCVGCASNLNLTRLRDDSSGALRSVRNELDSFADLFQGCSDDARDCFSQFPLEVNQLIFNFLPSLDLCSLRLSSRQIACIARPAYLPQSFWASRFATDKEMNFFSLQEYFSNPARFDNWRLLYAQVQHTLRDKTLSGYFRNRRRVWQCVGHLTQCLVPLLEQTRSLRSSNSLETELGSQGYSIGQESRRVVQEDASVIRGKGIRLFGKQSLLFRAVGYEAKTIQISVSFITFDCAEYVSGMRVFDRSVTGSITELSRAGLIMPYSEESIVITPNDQLIGIQVASSFTGIVGVSFLLQDGDGPTIQRAAGTVNNPAEGVGITTLRPRVGHKLSGLLIGFDACKFVSLKLLELQIDHGPSKSGRSGGTCLVPWYWHPAEPDHSHMAMSLHMPEAEKGSWIPTFALDMNMGGTDGSRLSRLNRIVALHDDRGGFFRGFAFFYTNGSKESFGMREVLDSASKRWTCIEQSIALDGPGGERIVKLGFVRLGDRCQVIKEEWFLSSAGRIITGILATAQLPYGSLHSFGLRCLADVPDASLDSRPRPPQITRTFPMKQPHASQAPQALQRSNSCFTSVVLSNIRRIGVSVGIPGRTRGPDHVSGLCFEFWDSKVPVYVGQWFHEVRSLPVGRRERITGFTFWQAQESHPNNAELENSGRITGIKISKLTHGHQEIAYSFGGKDDMLVYSFLANSYETLTGLAWSFDHQCDYIYALTQPRPATSLMLHDIADGRMPGKLFWEFQDGKGNWLQVSGIHTFFTDSKLSGLVFEYGNPRIYRQVGGIEGNRVSKKLEEGELITRIDIVKLSHGVEMPSSRGIIKFIKESVKGVTGQLHTSKNRKLSLQDVSNAYAGQGCLQPYEFGDPHGKETPGTPARKATLATLSETCGGTCVGIWVTMNVFPRATGIVRRIGPIVQKKLRELSSSHKHQEVLLCGNKPGATSDSVDEMPKC